MPSALKISPSQLYKLNSLARGSEDGVQGQASFSSGWPTFDALEKRGLIKIEHVRSYRYRAILTDAGWAASSYERP